MVGDIILKVNGRDARKMRWKVLREALKEKRGEGEVRILFGRVGDYIDKDAENDSYRNDA